MQFTIAHQVGHADEYPYAAAYSANCKKQHKLAPASGIQQFTKFSHY
jgi:hypothetical protein